MDKQMLEKLLSIYGNSKLSNELLEVSKNMNSDNSDDLSEFEVFEFTESQKNDLIGLLNDLLPELRPLESFDDLLLPVDSPNSSIVENVVEETKDSSETLVSKNIMQIYWRLGTLVHYFNNFFDVPTVFLINVKSTVFKDIGTMPALESSMNRKKLDTINQYIRYWLRQFYWCDEIIDSLEYESGMVEMVTLLVLNIFSQLRASLPLMRPLFDHHWDGSICSKFDDRLQSIVRSDRLSWLVQHQLEQERIEHQQTKENLRKLQLQLDEMKVSLQKSQENVKKLKTFIDHQRCSTTSTILNSGSQMIGTSTISNSPKIIIAKPPMIDFSKPQSSSSSSLIIAGPKQSSTGILNSSLSSSSELSYKPIQAQLQLSSNSLLTSSTSSSSVSKQSSFGAKISSMRKRRRVGRPRKTLDGENDFEDEEEDEDEEEEEEEIEDLTKSTMKPPTPAKHTYLAAPSSSKKIRFGPSGLGSGSITINNRHSIQKTSGSHTKPQNSLTKSLIVSGANQRKGLLNGKTLASGKSTTTAVSSIASQQPTVLPKPIQMDHPEYYLCSNVLDSTVSCRICNKRSESAELFAREHLPEHRDVQVVHCTWSNCHRFFRSNYKLKRHLLSHTGERPFKCRQCNKTFARSDKLKEHLRAHLKDGPAMAQIQTTTTATKSLKKIPLEIKLETPILIQPKQQQQLAKCKQVDSLIKPKIECEEEIEDSDVGYNDDDDDDCGGKKLVIANLVPNIDGAVEDDEEDEEMEHQKAINETMANVVDGVSINDENLMSDG